MPLLSDQARRARTSIEVFETRAQLPSLQSSSDMKFQMLKDAVEGVSFHLAKYLNGDIGSNDLDELGDLCG